MLNRQFLLQLESTPDLARFLLAFIIFFLFIAGSFAVVVKQKTNTEQLALITLELCVITKDFIADANTQDITSKNQYVKAFDDELLKLQTLPNIPKKDIEMVNTLWKRILQNTEKLRNTQHHSPASIASTLKYSVKNDTNALIATLKQMIQHDHMPNEVIMIALGSWLCCGISFFGYIRVKNRTQPAVTSSVERC